MPQNVKSLAIEKAAEMNDDGSYDIVETSTSTDSKNIHTISKLCIMDFIFQTNNLLYYMYSNI